MKIPFTMGSLLCLLKAFGMERAHHGKKEHASTSCTSAETWNFCKQQAHIYRHIVQVNIFEGHAGYTCTGTSTAVLG